MLEKLVNKSNLSNLQKNNNIFTKPLQIIKTQFTVMPYS